MYAITLRYAMSLDDENKNGFFQIKRVIFCFPYLPAMRDDAAGYYACRLFASYTIY